MNPEAANESRNTMTAAGIVAVFVFFAAFYALFVRGLPPNGDPVNYYVVAQSIAETGGFALEKNPYVPLEKGPDGAYYSKFAPGQSLLEAPFYTLGRALSPADAGPRYDYAFKYFVTVLSVPVVSALALVFFMLTVRRLGFSGRTALLSTLALGLCTMMWPYAKLGFSEPLQACALAACFYFSVRAGRDGLPAAAALAGAAAGALALTKVSAAVVAPAFAVYILAGRHGLKKGFRLAAIYSIVFLAFFALMLAYNQLRFGDYMNFGYFSGKDAAFGFGVNWLAGLYGFLFSPGKSIFLYAPFVLLSLWGARRLHRDYGAESLLVWFCAAAHLAVYSRWWAWHGDWSWGPRFLMPLMPLLAVPAAALIESLRRSPFIHRAAAAAIIVLSLFVQAPGVAVNPYEYISITRHQVPRGPFFTPGRADLRDDQLAIHFVPDFSPLAGHWWLLKHTAGAAGKTENEIRAVMQKDFPWRGLMRYAVPPRPERGVGFDFWWVHFPRHFPASAGWVRALLLCFLSTAFAAALLFLFNRQLRE